MVNKINISVAQLAQKAWAMEPQRLQAFFVQLAQLPADFQLISGLGARASAEAMTIAGETATIPIKGILMKGIPVLFEHLGIVLSSYLEIQSQVRQAMEDGQVKEIILVVDSPGGEIDGAIETAEIIRAARDQKKVTARVSGMAASAAYWLASQAGQIEAGPMDLVGSIGVHSVFEDYSKMFADAGVKVKVVKSGPYKGFGVIGAETTSDQLAVWQEIIDSMAIEFITAVARGRNRKFAEIKNLATGRPWLAKQAKQKGLIDKVFSPASSKPTGFVSAAKALAAERDISVTEAMRQLSVEHPELYQAEKARSLNEKPAGKVAGFLKEASALAAKLNISKTEAMQKISQDRAAKLCKQDSPIKFR